MKFLLFLGVVIAAVAVFFSGSLPYTLINDEESLQGVEYDGKEPIAAEVVRCEVDDTRNLSIGDALDTTFRAELRNNTNRYITISAIGEVFDPRGRSMGMNSQLFLLSPNSTEETQFRSNTPFTVSGTYTCEMRYAIGRFKY
jgi:hypothetical protein